MVGEVIEEVSSLSMQDFLAEFQNKRPVVIKNLADQWPALQKWSLNYLQETFGNRFVPARYFQDKGQGYKSVSIKLSDYINYLVLGEFNTKRFYVADWEISKDFRELLRDFSVPELFQKDYLEDFPSYLQFRRIWLFLGHPEVHTPAHTDAFATSAFITQIFGHKTFRIVPPGTKNFTSLFDDLETNLFYWETTLRKGSTLYIPGLFPHEIKNLDINLMVTKNFLEFENRGHSLQLFADKYQNMVNEIYALKHKNPFEQIS